MKNIKSEEPDQIVGNFWNFEKKIGRFFLKHRECITELFFFEFFFTKWRQFTKKHH